MRASRDFPSAHHSRLHPLRQTAALWWGGSHAKAAPHPNPHLWRFIFRGALDIPVCFERTSAAPPLIWVAHSLAPLARKARPGAPGAKPVSAHPLLPALARMFQTEPAPHPQSLLPRTLGSKAWGFHAG